MTSYLQLLNSIQRTPDRKLNDHVVIVDSMNTFIRSFVMLQSINPQGHHTGGLMGFLRSLGYLTRTLDPTRIICVFDGAGAASSRKAMNPQYKANRNLTRITNWDMFDGKDDEYASMTMQMHRLVEYLQCLPVTLISIDKVEADDVISYLAQGFASKGNKATIVSSDKDFLQIVQDNISVYSPIKKQVYTQTEVMEELGVPPHNYLVLKALLGDNSDNLSGVKGLGKKTVVTLFEAITSNKEFTLQDVYDVCEGNMHNKKIYAKVIYDWDKVKLNYDMMNLQQPRLSDSNIEYIHTKLAQPTPQLQTGPFISMLESDQIEALNKNVELWLENFRPLSTYMR